MKCKICGGTLSINNNVFVCDSCGATSLFDQAFESVEVFIAYIENDEYGRRSQDSTLANKLYNSLSQSKIETFYQRISIDGLYGESYKDALNIAISKAKIVIILATTTTNFNELLKSFENNINNKTIIPIYSGMNVNELPARLKALQAVNFDNIAASEDVVKSVLLTLGRETDFDIVNVYNKSQQKKKKTIITCISVVVTLCLAIGIYITFFTPLVLTEKKYDYAVQLMEEQKYVDAITAFNKITDYKDSEEKIKSIYEKYNGYYNDGKLELSVNIPQNDIIELSGGYDGCIFDISTNITSNIVKFSFVDSKQNNGTGTIEFTDTGIDIYIKADNVWEFNRLFAFGEKLDEKMVKFSSDILLGWLSGNITIEDLQTQGYDFQKSYEIHAGLGTVYKLKEQPVEIFTSYDGIVTALSAPAGIVAQTHIGNDAYPFLDGNTIYAAYGCFPNSSIFSITSYNDLSNKTISSETPVFITKKELVDEVAWEMMLEEIK